MISTPPITDHLMLAIRAYAKRQDSIVSDYKAQPKRRRSKLKAAPWVLIFDTETSTDPGQALRFGTYQVRHNGDIHCSGIFYAADNVTTTELDALRRYTEEHQLNLLNRDEIADQIFYKLAYQLRAVIVGFNLPFDISRIAISHDSARNEMRGGFTFQISQQKFNPNVRVKHLSRHAAFIRFAAPFKQLDNRSDRRKGWKNDFRAGHFVDVKTLAHALFARSFSLASLSEFLNIDNPKLDFDDFSAPISPAIIEYAVRDVQATWECYANLIKRYAQLDLPDTPPEKIYSEASIGKAYMKAMGISGWQKRQPEFPADMLGNMMGTYYGGRAEVHIRREQRQVILCDFLSMYPTVCTLMKLWPFVIAQGIIWTDATDEIRDFLGRVDSDAMQLPDTWQQLTVLVRVLPNADIFPVRAAYTGGPSSTIGANHLTSDTPVWYTLADCIAAKLLTGKAVQIVEAVRFEPMAAQSGLQPVNISGNRDYRVDPNTDDFFKRLIELRHMTKQRRATASGAKREALDTEQNNLKIVANAVSYGMYVEVNVADLGKAAETIVHHSTGEPFPFSTEKVEETGSYFHPLVATLICGAARLMLALTERHVIDQGLDWVFCDTDSMAIAKSDDMEQSEFHKRVQQIVDWFAALNPYDFGGSILKIETQNYALGDTSTLEPLYCWAVSSKRYALYNIDADGLPVIRKASAHGLGHLLAPYDKTNPAPGIPAPSVPLLDIGVERWQHDYWWQMIKSALGGHPDKVARDYHPALAQPALSRYAATTPELLRWFKGYNENRDYADQVKPFNFMTALIADPLAQIEPVIVTDPKARPRKRQSLKPVAPFTRDPWHAATTAFDRDTNAPIALGHLKSYAQALAQYHINPEPKFLNADFCHRGVTQRRHIQMIGTKHIGKEAHDWERQHCTGFDAESQPEYGTSDLGHAELRAQLTELIAKASVAKAAHFLKIPVAKLRAFVAGKSERGTGTFTATIQSRLPPVMALVEKGIAEERSTLEALREAVKRNGLRATAKSLGVDPSNLRRTTTN